MRPTLKKGVVEAEDRGKGRIVEAEPPVRAEHGDTFGEVVERLALYLDQRVVAALKRQPFGDVLVNPGHAALRIGIGDDPERLAVGQVPVLLLRLGGAVGGEEFVAPLPEVRLLGQLARRPQPVEDRILIRRRGEKRRVKIEELAVGGVAGFEAPVGAEDDDGGGELVKRAGVEVDLTAKRRGGRLYRGDIDGDPAAAARRRHVDHIEDPALARDHRRQALDEDGIALVAGLNQLAAGRVDELELAGDCVILVACLDRRRIGGVDPEQAARLVAEPDRHRRHREHGAHGIHFRLEEGIARLNLGTRKSVAGEVAKTDDRRTADRAPMRHDQPVRDCRDREVEGLAALTEGSHRPIEPGGRFGLQPGAEGEKTGAIGRRAAVGWKHARDERRRAIAAPGDKPLVVAAEHRLGAVHRGP